MTEQGTTAVKFSATPTTAIIIKALMCIRKETFKKDSKNIILKSMK